MRSKESTPVVSGGGLVTFDSCDRMDCSLPGSSVHGILQARILQWVAISFPRGSSQSRKWIQVFCIAGRFFTDWATREAHSILWPFCVSEFCLDEIELSLQLGSWCFLFLNPVHYPVSFTLLYPKGKKKKKTTWNTSTKQESCPRLCYWGIQSNTISNVIEAWLVLWCLTGGKPIHLDVAFSIIIEHVFSSFPVSYCSVLS